MRDIKASVAVPEAIALVAADGCAINGFVWRHRKSEECESASARPVVIVNAATSVRCRYYFRFAAFLHSHGYDAIVYDYRGIGESRPSTLRGFRASWLDWGQLDFEALLQYAAREFAGQPVDVVAHSIGGFVIGLAPSNGIIRRIVTMGAQYAFWRDYAPERKRSMLWRWHVLMPLLAVVIGYVPAKRLGWMEDTPKGVALSWSGSKARFEETYRHGEFARSDDERARLVEQCSAVRAALLAISVTDDEFGTVAAIERLLGYFTGSALTHLRVAPEQIGHTAIGHFAFFHSRFEDSMWRIPLAWLKSGALPDDVPGNVVSQRMPAIARHEPAHVFRRALDSMTIDLSTNAE
ncbi:alpha/beta hydrolase [Burkholderia sp. Leaf177]|uniref:alpha/beta hydrolase family protein n=1 Tax=Burkholderia sp. Leaf177 TaxID=1736287 RepID=UPI0006F1F9CE|nr:alpha/beta fold hydrolase [Burkholderia sp. Leaf177]KQR81655.1 alpha/beta hydrolase [Burkholderia sp. Leaf177]